jgi:alpha-mannosidase
MYNARGPSYPNPYFISEPVAGNYYPVNSMIAVDDGVHELVVLTDVSMGGASLRDGQVELMVHRRIQDDDARGVNEPLNETMCGCNDITADAGRPAEDTRNCECQGLTMRGRHWLLFDTVPNAHTTRRQLVEALNFPATLAFAVGDGPAQQAAKPSFSALARALPPNVKLVTLTSNYASFNGGAWLLRLSHMYSTQESTLLASPVTFSLADVFSKVVSCEVDSIFSPIFSAIFSAISSDD